MHFFIFWVKNKDTLCRSNIVYNDLQMNIQIMYIHLHLFRVRIVLLDEEGVSERKIAERMKISKTGVHNTIKRFKETGQYCDLPRPGQPRKIDEHGDRHTTKLSVKQKINSSTNNTMKLLNTMNTTHREMKNLFVSGQ